MSKRIEEILKQGHRCHDLEPPAGDSDVSKLKTLSRFELPEEYIEFLLTFNGGSGELPVQPCWYELWSADDVLENNDNYEVTKELPEFFAIGSNQGGELIYIDYRAEAIGNIVSIPLIPSDSSYANKISDSFENLISLLGLECKCG